MAAAGSRKHPLSLSDFRLENAAFEVRYETAYLLWDHAGSISKEISVKWPRIRNVEGSPAKISFVLEDSYSFTVELGKSFGVAYHPQSNLEDFSAILEFFVGLVTKVLQVSAYERVGLRLTYFRTYPDKESASRALTETQIMQLPDGSHFGIDGQPMLPEFGVRWESETQGTTVVVRSEERGIDVERPLGVSEIDPIHIKKFGIKADFDYFIKAPVPVEKFRLEDWINQAVHVIRRDGPLFLGG